MLSRRLLSTTDSDREKSDQVISREEYAHIEENRFLQAKQEPLSTFSIDVDAASYSVG
jgi:Ca-activated chloride channel family protein